MKKLFAALAVFLLLAGFALADTAQEITADCTMTMGGKPVPVKNMKKMLDDDYSTFYTIKPKKMLTVENPAGISGIYLQQFDQLRKMTLEARVGDEWQLVADSNPHLTDWFTLPEGATAFRIANKDNWNLWIGEIAVYGPGEKPDDVHCWEDLERCDLMLFAAHPDDDLLWFAGLLPTYAGAKGLKVQVAYLVPTGGERKLELLDALWICGVRAYPAMLDFRDVRGKGMDNQYERWGGKNKVIGRVIKAIRQYKPSVVVTQGEKGEYGHGAHKVTCDAVKHAVANSGKKDKYSASVDLYGTWEVQKLYLHEYEKNQLHMDWHIPLEAFGGQDAFAIASQAMACHASQVKRGWALEDPGEHDNTLFGLYYTAVGQDTEKNDLMEHVIPLSELEEAGA